MAIETVRNLAEQERLKRARPTLIDLSDDYDPRGKYIPQSGTGTWKISGSGTGLNAAGYPIGTQPSETITQTTSYAPGGPRPVMGEVETAKIPGAPELPILERPELAEVSPYDAPEWDEAEISRLTQARASGGIRGLRAATQAISRQRFENPNVRRMTLRDALRGYGEGLEAVMSGAAGVARAEYGQKHAIETEEAKINYNQAVADRNAIFNADIHADDANFQAAIDNINRVYGTEVAVEMQRVADVNTRNKTIFSAAMEDYLKTGTETITKTTGPGTGATEPRTTAEAIRSGGTLDYQRRVWDSKKAAVDSLAYNDPLKNLAAAQLGQRP